MVFKITCSLLALAVISHGFPYPYAGHSDGQNNESRYSNNGAYGPSPGAPRNDGFGPRHSEYERFRPNAISPGGFISLELHAPRPLGPAQINPAPPRFGDDQHAPERQGLRPVGSHRYDLYYGPGEYHSNHFGHERFGRDQFRPRPFAREYFGQGYFRPNHFANGHARHIDFSHFRPNSIESDLAKPAGYDYGFFPEDVPFNNHQLQLPRQLGRD